MSIILTGLNSYRNRGVEALAVTTIDGLTRHLPGHNITNIANDVKYNALRMTREHVTQFEFDHWSTNNRLARRFGAIGKIFKSKISPAGHELEKQIASASLAVASGGDNFSSDYGIPYEFTWPMQFAADRGVPTVLIGQSIGPFRRLRDAEVFMQMCTKIDRITVREQISYDYLTQDLKLPAEKIEKTADSAFLLPIEDETWSESLLSHWGFTENRPRIAVSISGGISKFTDANRSLHRTRMAALIRELAKRYDAQILVVPHVIDPAPQNDDLAEAAAVMEELGWPRDVQLAVGEFNASQYKGLIARCDLLVAERMHAAIAGLSSTVPTVVISYSIKAPGIMAEVLGADRVEAFVEPMADFLEHDRVYEKIQDAWANRDAVRQDLAAALPAVREQADRNYQIAAELVTAKAGGDAKP
ncbi:MAG: polysaccharide pyruvyl transferase family protein [Planctomycetota bacterium]